jgi:hypothetical protein
MIRAVRVRHWLCGRQPVDHDCRDSHWGELRLTTFPFRLRVDFPQMLPLIRSSAGARSALRHIPRPKPAAIGGRGKRLRWPMVD